MKAINTVLLTPALVLVASATFAGEFPAFYEDTYPEHALARVMEADATLMGDKAKLNPKTRELIALGVAAQIPCRYCVYVHDKKARQYGATEAEVREAVATAAHVRHWSTVLNGMAYEFDTFKAEVDQLLAPK